VVVKHERCKDCWIQKHDMFLGPNLLVKGGVSDNQYQDKIIEAFVHPFADAIGQDFVLMDENACPRRACDINECIKLEWNRTHGLALMLIQKSMGHTQQRITARPAQPHTWKDLVQALI